MLVSRFVASMGLVMVGCLAVSPAAMAQMTNISQARELQGVGFNTPINFPYTPEPGGITAVGFGPFAQSLNLGTPSPFFVASQNSTISAGGVIASGESVAEGIFYKANYQGQTKGDSIFSYTFSLAGPGAFTLDGDLSRLTIADYATVFLVGPSTNISHTLVGFQNFAVTFNEAGTLQAGTYTLYAQAKSWDITNPLSPHGADFDLEFTVTPAPSSLAAMTFAGLIAMRRRRMA